MYGVLFNHLGLMNNIESYKFSEYILAKNTILLMVKIWIKMFYTAKKVSSRNPS